MSIQGCYWHAPVAFSEFGSVDEGTYRQYLSVWQVWASDVGVRVFDAATLGQEGEAVRGVLGLSKGSLVGGQDEGRDRQRYGVGRGCAGFGPNGGVGAVDGVGHAGGVSGSVFRAGDGRGSDGDGVGAVVESLDGDSRSVAEWSVESSVETFEGESGEFVARGARVCGTGSGVSREVGGSGVVGVSVAEGSSRVKRRNAKKNLRRRAEYESFLRGEVEGLSDAQRRRCEKKHQKKVDVESRVPEWRQAAVPLGEQSEKDELRLSLERKWKAKNALEARKAERELALLDSESLEAVKGLREKKLRAATEKAMVQTERAHATLVATGNVPGVQSGFCETVVDGEVVSGSATRVCSISPSSSISEKEVRQMQKELADVTKRNEELEARNADLTNTLELYKRGEKVDEQVSRMYCESVPVTVNSEGEVPMDVLWKAGDKYEGKEFLEIGPLIDGKRTVKFDRYAFSRSGAYSKDYEAFDTY